MRPKSEIFNKLLLAVALFVLASCDSRSERQGGLTIEISTSSSVVPAHEGRLIVILSEEKGYEPRILLEYRTQREKPFALAKDVNQNFPVTITDSDLSFPVKSGKEIRSGTYYVQALYNQSTDLRGLNAPGNLVSPAQKIKLKKKSDQTIKITLDSVIVEPEIHESEYVKNVKIESKLLSAFRGRPAIMKAGVILPKSYDPDNDQKYPLWIHIGGGNSSFDWAEPIFKSKEFKKAWGAPDAPPFIFVHLDNRGPYGNPYHVNSANSGPYGDALTTELIPEIERLYKGSGVRVVEGTSSGGWSALALQIFYPDFFAGAWAGQPDPVDLHAFMQTNLYEDKNIFVDSTLRPRPAYRSGFWVVPDLISEEFRYEMFISPHSNYALSGADWGAWDALLAPRDVNGVPLQIWNGGDGTINHDVALKTKPMDLTAYLKERWETIGSKLDGKLHVWVGDSDTYFLNDGVKLMEDFLKSASPAANFSVRYGKWRGHAWTPYKVWDLMGEMYEASKP